MKHFYNGKKLMVFFSLLILTVFVNCGDKNSPEYWLEKLKKPLYSEKSLSELETMWANALKKAGQKAEDTKEFRDKVVEPLVAAYNQYKSQPRTAKRILQILVQTRDPRAVPVFIDALQKIDGVSVEQARLGADGIANLCRDTKTNEDQPPPENERSPYWTEGCNQAVKSIPTLLKVYNDVRQQRQKRGDVPNTADEDFLTRSIIAAAGLLILSHPDNAQKNDVIDALVTAIDTPDTYQDLAINMQAVKLLGAFGDPRGIPALIRAIFIQGRRRPVALQEIAKSSIQQISDLDAVVTGLLRAVKREDQDLMRLLRDDERFDQRIINEQVDMLLGDIGIARNDVTEYLMGELNHSEPDQLDQMPEPEGRPDMPPDVWVATRNGWAARALGKLNHKPAEDIIIQKLGVTCTGNECNISAHANAIAYYIESLFFFLDPEKTTPIFSNLARVPDDAIRLNSLLRLAWQGGYNLVPLFEEIQRDYANEECDPDLPQCLKNEIPNAYLPRIRAAQNCNDVACWLQKLNDSNWRIRQKAIYMLAILANNSNRDQIRQALIDKITDPQEDVVNAIIFVYDRLSIQGADEDVIREIQNLINANRLRTGKSDINRELVALKGRLRYKAAHHG